jgi:hypothetical protein
VFLQDFFSEAFVRGSLDKDMIVCCINFLKSIVKHSDIPTDSTFKGRSILVLSFFLNPLANLAKTIKEREIDLEISEELIEAIDLGLREITTLLPSGFMFETISVEIAKEFVEAIEMNYSILVSRELNCLDIYMELFRYDVRFQ